MKVAFFEFKKTLEQKKYLVFGLVVSFIVFNIFFFLKRVFTIQTICTSFMIIKIHWAMIVHLFFYFYIY